MISSLMAFIIMLNPFALFLYLEPIRKDLSYLNFIKVLIKATLISFFICFFFFIVGDLVFSKFLQIDFESFRVFGGIIIFSFAYFFIVKGQQALIHMKEDLDDLASEIALPFMVGAGTISLSILLSQNSSFIPGLIGLIFVFLSNFLILVFFTFLRKSINKKKIRIAFDKNMSILLRLNGFLLAQ